MKFLSRPVRRAGLALCVCVIAARASEAQQALSPDASRRQPGVEQSAAGPFPGEGSELAPERPRRTFKTLFMGTLRDIDRMRAPDNLPLLAFGGMAAMAVHPSDHALSGTLSAKRSLEAPFNAGKTIGGVHVQVAGTIAALAIGQITSSDRVKSVGVDLLRGQIVSQAVTHSLKFSVQRARPDGTNYSFPSGHTSTSFASATVLQHHFGWRVGVPAFAVASYVAASRIQERRHFLSDVVFGAAIGLASGRAVTVGRGAARFAVAPMAAPGGGGVALSLVNGR